MLNDMVCQLKLLSPGSLFKASLHDTATMFMHSNINAIRHASIEDELSVLLSRVTSVVVGVSRLL